MKFLRICLLPITILYACLTAIRNILYDAGIFTSTSFNTPIIVVGNLSTGGTGKTPHIEYLIRLLKSEFNIATLSRGYKRKTTGFVLADKTTSAFDIGDEPLQFKTKFPSINVAVAEQRKEGIEKLEKKFSDLQLVLLDDAFQHRAVKPGFSILLTEYANLYSDDFVLPTGNLRELANGSKRADVIIVTKCPLLILKQEQEVIKNKLHALPKQNVFFSFIKYSEIVSCFDNTARAVLTKEVTVLLFTGIANTTALENYIKEKVAELKLKTFPDHHIFTRNDLEVVKGIFTTIATENKIIVTTEKDAMRLKHSPYIDVLDGLPLFYLPIEIDFIPNDKLQFDKLIFEYVRKNSRNN